MSIFAQNESMLDDDITMSDRFVEAVICSEFVTLSDDDRAAFLESAECEALIQEGLVSRKTLVRLSKNDDYSRRVKMAAYELARENKDPLWDKLKKNRIMERKLINAIVKKYGAKSSKTAKMSQKAYIKANRNAFKNKPVV